MSFTWRPDDPPPIIESHTEAKLQVLRRYLRAYFDTLNVIPGRETFKLDLVDGFSGGGTYLDNGNELLSGSPLVMIEETDSAEFRLNDQRRKPLHIDCQFYFIDKTKAHTDHLCKVLTERGLDVGEGKIVVHNSRFSDALPEIIQSIRKRQPLSGRAVFLLDQKGYNRVALAEIARIFRELPTAEVILTFAADILVNFLEATPEMVKAVAPLQLDEAGIRNLIRQKEEGGRALVQRTLRSYIRTLTGATFDTPFFIRPVKSRRALWFLHLSRHPTARNVMIQQHWKNQNTFQHYGPGDFGMLGWDALKDSETPHLFNFTELDEREMRENLLDSLPRELYALVAREPVTVDAIRHDFANKTAARFSDIDLTILRLFEEREFTILNPDGKPRSRSLKRLKHTDLIAMPRTLLFPELSRLHDATPPASSHPASPSSPGYRRDKE